MLFPTKRSNIKPSEEGELLRDIGSVLPLEIVTNTFAKLLTDKLKLRKLKYAQIRPQCLVHCTKKCPCGFIRLKSIYLLNLIYFTPVAPFFLDNSVHFYLLKLACYRRSLLTKQQQGTTNALSNLSNCPSAPTTRTKLQYNATAGRPHKLRFHVS